MPKSTFYAVTDKNGFKHYRSSARPYSHAIVGPSGVPSSWTMNPNTRSIDVSERFVPVEILEKAPKRIYVRAENPFGGENARESYLEGEYPIIAVLFIEREYIDPKTGKVTRGSGGMCHFRFEDAIAETVARNEKWRDEGARLVAAEKVRFPGEKYESKSWSFVDPARINDPKHWGENSRVTRLAVVRVDGKGDSNG